MYSQLFNVLFVDIGDNQSIGTNPSYDVGILNSNPIIISVSRCSIINFTFGLDVLPLLLFFLLVLVLVPRLVRRSGSDRVHLG